jgi:hypothetical protein
MVASREKKLEAFHITFPIRFKCCRSGELTKVSRFHFSLTRLLSPCRKVCAKNDKNKEKMLPTEIFMREEYL